MLFYLKKALISRATEYEQQHDKTNKITCAPSKDSGPSWSESSLCAWWVAEDLSFFQVDSQDSDQTGWMPRLICFCWVHRSFVGFVMPWLILKETIMISMLFFPRSLTRKKKKKKGFKHFNIFSSEKVCWTFPCVKSLQLPIHLFSPIRVWVPTLVRVSQP